MKFEELVGLINEILKTVPDEMEGEMEQLQDLQGGKDIFFTKKINGKTGEHVYTYHAQIKDNNAHINFWMDEGTTELTDEGNAPQVLNAAIYFINKIATDHQPERITFEALKGIDPKESSSRGDVYLRLLNRFASGKGYKVTRETTGGKDLFVLSK